MKKTNINKLKRSRLYSEELGIKLNEKSDEEQTSKLTFTYRLSKLFYKFFNKNINMEKKSIICLL
jgi:hypothetical protein